MNESQYVIEMEGITKAFGTFKANDNINLKVKKGEIHALLGENGAGKSTLMNILSGLLEPTSGTIKINGKEVQIANPTVANELGIGMVHQHFMLIDNFSIAENIILGSEPTNAGMIDKKKRMTTLSLFLIVMVLKSYRMSWLVTFLSGCNNG